MAVSAFAVSAQQVTEFRRPGDVIRVEVNFSGADADKVTSISLYLTATGSLPANQVGFQNGFGGNWTNATSPHTFVTEAKIPADAVTGDYKLFVNARGEAGSTQYTAGDQFQLPLFHIKNERSFVPPAIAVTELH
jgi:hypothetical protein